MDNGTYKETLRFLFKVLIASLGISLLIKGVGQRIPAQIWEGRSLNVLAITIVTLPSLLVGTFLLIQTRYAHRR